MWKVLLITWFVGICSVVSCPHHCQCYLDEGLKTANCSGSALSTHQQQPSQIDVLNVRPHYSGFRTRLSPKGFKTFKNIKYLNLSNTSVTTIPDDVFHGLNYIITIDLSYNKIKRLNGGVFKELITLQTLLLRGNPLRLTKSDIILSKSLRKLDMGYCGLHNIPVGTFAHVMSLTALFLDGNYIQTLGENIVPTRVSYLNLANNHIVNVPTDVLRSMKSLTRIDLSGNPIKCTCHLLLLQDTFSGQARSFENDIICTAPIQFFGQKLSHINENDLCNLEFTKKQRLTNSIKYSGDLPSNRKHNMIKSLYDEDYGIQGDQPFINNEFLNTPSHDGDVNDYTGTMGAHMTNSFTKRNLNTFDSFSDENNKLSDSKPNVLSPDPTSTDAEISNEQIDEETPENLKMPEEYDNIQASSNKTDETLKVHESVEDSVELEGSPPVGEYESVTTEKTEEEEEEEDEDDDDETKSKTSSIVSSSIESETMKPTKEGTDSTLSTNHTVHELTSDHETSSKELNEHKETSVVHNVEELTSETEDTSASSLDDVEELISHAQNSTHDTLSHYTEHEHHSDTSRLKDGLEDFTSDLHNRTNEYTDHDHINTSDFDETSSSVLDDDAEELTSDIHNFTHEIMSRNLLDENITTELDNTSSSSLDEIFNTVMFTTTRPETQTYMWPSSKTDMTDYNYDAQHDDYSSVEPLNTTENTSGISNQQLTTEVYLIEEDKLTTDTNTTSSFSIEPEEGSGDYSNETYTDDKHITNWLEEQENETTTEDYSVQSISEVFNITSEEAGLSRYTFENTSSSDTMEDTTTTSTDITASSSSSTNGTESEEIYGTITEESTTEEITTEETTFISDISSEEISTSQLDNETQTITTEQEEEEEQTTSLPTEETTEEFLTTTEQEVSSSSSDASSSSSSSTPIEVTSESITTVSDTTSEETTTELTETSTDSTPFPVYIPGQDDEDDGEEDVVASSSSTTSASASSEPTTSLDTSSPIVVDIMVQSSTEPTPVSSTPIAEVEFVSKSVYIDDKENIILDPTKEEISKTAEKSNDSPPDIATIGIIALIILLVIIIIVISLAVVCRRTKRPKNKIRLPADPEANIGTEMQDMLLPKPPENGVKVVPKNYTNGTTTANGNKPEQQKEEETPVLQNAEPEQMPENDWEDKPEPIETVTARLSMLARPQTPVFIPKTVN